jgi:hypothetical protein
MVRVHYGENDPHNALIHIRAIVDKKYVIFARWEEGEWLYDLEHIRTMWWKYEAGFLNDAGKTSSRKLEKITDADT